VILGASFDTPAENKAFAEKFSFNFPLLCDTTRAMGLAYGATEAGASGGAKRIAVIIGPDGKVKQFVPKADSRSYPTEALKDL